MAYKVVYGDHNDNHNNGSHSMCNHSDDYCVEDGVHLTHSHNNIYPEGGSHSSNDRDSGRNHLEFLLNVYNHNCNHKMDVTYLLNLNHNDSFLSDVTCNSAVSLGNAAKFCMVDGDCHNCHHLIHNQSNRIYNQRVVVCDGSVYHHDSDNCNCMMNHLQSHIDSHSDGEVLRIYSKVCEEMAVVLLGDHSCNDNRSLFLTHNHSIDNRHD